MIERFTVASVGELRGAARVQARVLGALMLREAIARFGNENIGFFWLFVEPLLLSGAVMLIWTVTGLHKGHGVGIVPFILASYSLLSFWRDSASSSARLLKKNVNLLYHRNIQILDILIARISLKSLGGLAGFTVAFIVLNILGYVEDMKDPLATAGAWLLMTWFCFSFSLVIAAVTDIFEVAEHFVGPFLYITLPLTGAFYMVLWMPTSVQAALLWSPLVHIFEMFRGGLFGHHTSIEWSVLYVAAWCFGLMAIGLPMLRIAQARFTSV